MIKGNIITAIAALALSAVTYVLAGEFEPIVDDAPGPGFVPKLLAGAMAILAVALLGQTWHMAQVRKRLPDEDFGDPKFNTPGVRIAYVFVLVCIGYAVLVALFGFVIGSLAFIPAGMYVMGERSVKSMVLLAVGAVGIFYLVFAHFFNMTLPTGILFD